MARFSRKARGRRTAVAVLVVPMLVLLGPAGVAAANDPGADGRDPYQYPSTGNSCAKNASIVASGSVFGGSGRKLGTGYLWYSWTCGTNWSEVRTSVSAGGSSGWLYTDAVTGPPFEQQIYQWDGNFPVGARSWSDMVYAPTTCASGSVGIGLANLGDSGMATLQDPTC
ncbi:hypothetical protein AB0K00_56225 [Dactylosporangium sp. NPDC049525]|uniref:hypothetical protein n=1 Tax=Dactylosporangium sp. NPDC049525 TaxID=3154730 RepID=UPI003418D62B